MNPLRYFVILAILAFAASCSRTEPPTEIEIGWKSVPYVPNADAYQEERELELREFIFRNEIAGPIRDEIVYISFGYAVDSNWIEPPDGFINRFSDLPVVVRSVSDANLFNGGLTSKTDDRVGHIYYVQIVEWLDDNTVKTDHALYGGPMYGGGVRGAIYEYNDRKWTLKTRGQYYIS